jgi:polyferredoxin
LIYAAGFEYITHKPNWMLGAAFGIVHWLVAGVFLGMMSSMHPLMTAASPTAGQLAAPGFFAANFGIMAIVAVLVLYIIYGAIVGALYTTEHREI